VLDAGCGEGRNAIYFVQEGYDYLGIDSDNAKIQLADYMSNNISTSKAEFKVGDIRKDISGGPFDLIICSRVLHFANSENDFLELWHSLTEKLNREGLIYVCMDSVIDNTLGIEAGEGKHEFPDGAIRFTISGILFNKIKKGFKVIEPLKTLVHNETRAQSYFTLKKL
jgi:SAM-dependent methyltransferase